jgi:hypothetical protein
MWKAKIHADGGIDYRRWDYVWRQHHRRYSAYVEAHGLLCQECGGLGEHSRGSYEPPDYCGWCESTGKIPRWVRGRWLRWKAEEARKTRRKKAAKAA